MVMRASFMRSSLETMLYVTFIRANSILGIEFQHTREKESYMSKALSIHATHVALPLKLFLLGPIHWYYQLSSMPMDQNNECTQRQKEVSPGSHSSSVHKTAFHFSSIYVLWWQRYLTIVFYSLASMLRWLAYLKVISQASIQTYQLKNDPTTDFSFSPLPVHPLKVKKTEQHR